MRKVSAKNIQWLEKELPILETESVLAPEAIQNIRSYYADRTSSGLHWAVIAFAIFGSLLIGAGIILLFAHNWDELTRPARAVISFLPVLIGATLSVTALVNNGGTALRESAGIFHSLAVGASIALIGQTYHLPSNTPDFLLSWALLILPLQFLLSSTGSFLIYLGLICGWSGSAQYEYGQAIGFWLLLLPPIGKLWAMLKIKRHEPDTLVSFFGVMLTLLISTGVVFERTLPGLWIVAYSALLSSVALLGIRLYGNQEGWSNPPKLIGLIGIGILAYLFTWSDLWHDIGWNNARNGWHYKAWGNTFDIGFTVLFIGGWLMAAIKAFRRNNFETITLAVFPIFGIVCFFVGSLGGNETNTLTALFFNIFMLFYGIMYIVIGCRNTKLRQLNGGMAVLALLLVTRFFDEDFRFLARGIVFILLGVCFLTVNLIMAKRKKTMEIAL